MRYDREKMQRARERLGYSIETVGEKAGTSKNSVLRAEHEGEIRPITARKIAEALGVNVADLLQEEAESYAPKVEELPFPEPPSEEGSEQQRRASLPDLKDFLQEKCGSFYLALPHDLVKQAWEEADTKETSWQLYEQIRREHAAVVKLADEIRDQLQPFQRDNLERLWLRQANTRMVEAIHRVRQKTDA